MSKGMNKEGETCLVKRKRFLGILGILIPKILSLNTLILGKSSL